MPDLRPAAHLDGLQRDGLERRPGGAGRREWHHGDDHATELSEALLSPGTALIRCNHEPGWLRTRDPMHSGAGGAKRSISVAAGAPDHAQRPPCADLRPLPAPPPFMAEIRSTPATAARC